MRTIDTIINDDLKIVQPEDSYRFNEDSIFLAHFIKSSANSSCSIADLGAGSGIISIILAKIKGFRKIDAIEINEQLYSCLLASMEKSKVNDFITPIYGDIRDIKFETEKRYDIVVSNPPYRSKKSANLSENQGLANAKFYGESSMRVKDIFSFCKKYLKQKGSLYISTNSENLINILSICREYSFEPKRMRFIHGTSRLKAKVCLIQLSYYGGVELHIEPPLIKKYDSGYYTTEYKSIFGN